MVLSTESCLHVYRPSSAATGQLANMWHCVCCKEHKSHAAESILSHRWKFELLGRLNISARLIKTEILVGKRSQTCFHVEICLEVASIFICCIIAFCSVNPARCSSALFSIWCLRARLGLSSLFTITESIAIFEVLVVLNGALISLFFDFFKIILVLSLQNLKTSDGNWKPKPN